MKLPNGYGSVTKLPGKRRNPWRVRKTVGWDANPKTGRVKQKTVNVGYFPTKAAALQALAQYNVAPETISSVTLTQVYEEWYEKKAPQMAPGTAAGYSGAWNHIKHLGRKRFRDVRISDIQHVVGTLGPGAGHILKSMLSLLYGYAVSREYIAPAENFARYLQPAKRGDSSKHFPFSDAELSKLWNASDRPMAQVILMLIYTGTRWDELCSLRKRDVHIDDEYFIVTDGKTENATRIVPIHRAVLPFFAERMKGDGEKLLGFSYYNAFRYCWNAELDELGIRYYEGLFDHERHEHLPHDTRHTFTSLWKANRLDEAFRRRIQGHAGSGIGEEVYMHLGWRPLCDELNRIPVPYVCHTS